MEFPEVDLYGELVCMRSGSDYGTMLQSVAPGNALLIVPAPVEPSWWDGAALVWVTKPPRPSDAHEWDALAKVWADRRTDAQVLQEAMGLLRFRRDRELVRSDLVALRALEALLPPAVRAWRQALRDLPATVADPANVQWPALPD